MPLNKIWTWAEHGPESPSSKSSDKVSVHAFPDVNSKGLVGCGRWWVVSLSPLH